MIAVITSDGVCFGLYHDKKSLEQVKALNPVDWEASMEDCLLREVNSLEELKLLMDEALVFDTFGEGDLV